MRNAFAIVIALVSGLGVAACGGDDSPAHPDATLPGDGSGSTTDATPHGDGGGTDAPPGTPTVSIAGTSVAEGNSGTTNATFTVTLSTASTSAVTVDFATADATADSGGDPTVGGADYTASNGTLTFAPGETQKSITIVVAGDALNEDDETFTVGLSNINGAVLGTAQATGTITNDDAAPTLTIADTTILEGTATATIATATVTLSAPSGRNVTVGVATADGTAVLGVDYTATTTTLTFAPGQTTQTVSVPITADALDEDDEQFTIGLSSAVDATIADASATVTITDDDAQPTVNLQDASIAEGNSGTTAVLVPITLSTASGRTVSVTFTTADDTATSGTDYVATAGTVTFAPGETSKTISVTVNGDTSVEADETLFVNLATATNVTLGDAQSTVTILDDDSTGPRITIADATLTEGNTGLANMVFVVTLSAPAPATVTVNFGTVDGTATAGGTAATGGQDYTTTSGKLTIGTGQSSGTISVPIHGDLLNETDETFSVVLAGATNASIQDAQALGKILNDDTAPTVTISDVTTAEGNTGSTNASFTVSLSATSGQTVTVAVATADVTATANADYTPVTSTLTFSPGSLTQTVLVPVLGDLLDEPNETYTVNLSSPTNATLAAKSAGTGTITDNDATPSISIANTSVIEGDAGTTTNAVFTLTLSAASGRQVTVNFATSNGTATIADHDYVATTGTATFAPGATTTTVPVVVNGDATNEVNQTFDLNLTTPVNATIADATGVATIINDDSPLPNMTINDVTVTEGNTGTVNATFTVKLSVASTLPVSVDFTTSDGTAVAGLDYTTTTNTLMFTAGQVSKTIVVPVIGDTLFEADETFFVNLTNPTNANLTDAIGKGTITDNDAAPALAISDVTTIEADTGTNLTASFVVTLSKVSGVAATVNFTTVAGTATADVDFATTNGTLTFAPGETTKTIDVPIIGDVLDEANETYTVKLSAPVNATNPDGIGAGTITDNDTPPSIVINDVTVAEGNAGTTPLTFTVTLSAPSGQTVTVAFATANNTAVAPSDYTAATGTLTFAPGTVTKTITVNVKGDAVSEGDESFFVNLSNPTNASIADNSGIGTITNDD